MMRKLVAFDIKDNGGAGGGASSRPDGYVLKKLYECSNSFVRKVQENKICIKKNRNEIIHALCNKYEIDFDELYKIITFDEDYILENTLKCWGFYVDYEFQDIKEIKYDIIKLMYSKNQQLSLKNMKDMNAICTLKDGCCLTKRTRCNDFKTAVESKHTYCFRYLCETAEPDTSDIELIHKAMENGSYDMFVMMCKRGFDMDEYVTGLSLGSGRMKFFDYLLDNEYDLGDSLFETIARYGNIEHMKKAHKFGYEPTPNTCYFAAMTGDIACLRFAHNLGCQIGYPDACVAIKHEKKQCLEYILQHIEDKTGLCDYAAENNAIEMLRMLHKHNCPWTLETCNKAAENDGWQCLIYANTHGCPIDETTLNIALENDSTKCIKYLMQEMKKGG